MRLAPGAELPVPFPVTAPRPLPHREARDASEGFSGELLISEHESCPFSPVALQTLGSTRQKALVTSEFQPSRPDSAANQFRDVGPMAPSAMFPCLKSERDVPLPLKLLY